MKAQPTTTIEVTPEQLNNIVQGLECLQSKCLNNMSKVNATDKHGEDLKAYYRDKEKELSEQIKGAKTTLETLYHV